MKTWFTSDWHFHHDAMVRGGRIGNRDRFASVGEMNGHIIERINETCKPEDFLWMLGDVTLKRKDPLMWLSILNQIDCDMGLLLGNHDYFTAEDYHIYGGFKQVAASIKMHKLLFCHIPLHPSQFYRFRANVHGHLHEKHIRQGPEQQPEGSNWARDPRYINVCIEPRDYRPVSLEQLLAEAPPWTPPAK